MIVKFLCWRREETRRELATAERENSPALDTGAGAQLLQGAVASSQPYIGLASDVSIDVFAAACLTIALKLYF